MIPGHRKVSDAEKWRAQIEAAIHSGAAAPVAKMLLKRDNLARLSPEELRIFYQVLRMINSLRSLMKLHLKIGKGIDHLESVKDQIELHLLTSATYYEAAKTFVGTILPRVRRDDISISNRKKLDRIKRLLGSDRRGTFLHVAGVIRNQVVFHFDSFAVNKYVTEGEPKSDILIGYARSRSIFDCIYLEPYSTLFAFLSEHVPRTVSQKEAIQWITNKATKHIDDFCRILEQIANSFFRRNGVLQTSSVSEILS